MLKDIAGILWTVSQRNVLFVIYRKSLLSYSQYDMGLVIIKDCPIGYIFSIYWMIFQITISFVF